MNILMHSGVGRNVHWEKRGYITPKNYLIFLKKGQTVCERILILS